MSTAHCPETTHCQPGDLAVPATPAGAWRAVRGAATFIGPVRALPACLNTLTIACREHFATMDAIDHA